MLSILGKYTNGNTDVVIMSDGTKIRKTNDDEFKPAFAENMDIKICNRCNVGCPMCHEGSCPDGKLGDILNERFIDTLHPYQEVAIGGGNVLEHPDLIPFLERLKDKKVIANITINQVHFEQEIDLIRELVNKKLIYGLGISLMKPTKKLIRGAQEFENAVIHVINGIFTFNDVKALRNNGLKILILGYKQLRRGETWYTSKKEDILSKQQWLKYDLPEIFKEFKVVSFDNLALEQLNVKRLLTEEEWNRFYAGDDGTFTYYIDMVERQFARSSTAPMNERYPLMDNVDDMFSKITLQHNNKL